MNQTTKLPNLSTLKTHEISLGVPKTRKLPSGEEYQTTDISILFNDGTTGPLYVKVPRCRSGGVRFFDKESTSASFGLEITDQSFISSFEKFVAFLENYVNSNYPNCLLSVGRIGKCLSNGTLYTKVVDNDNHKRYNTRFYLTDDLDSGLLQNATKHDFNIFVHHRQRSQARTIIH